MHIKAGLLLVVLLTGLGLALRQSTATAAAAGYCTINNFALTVRRGPTQGFTFTGRLSLLVNGNGALSGSFLSNDHQVYVQRVVGQENGHAISLVFDLGYSGSTQKYLFAIGTLWNTFSDCSGPMGGLFIGPQDGDSGDWHVTPGGAS